MRHPLLGRALVGRTLVGHLLLVLPVVCAGRRAPTVHGSVVRHETTVSTVPASAVRMTEAACSHHGCSDAQCATSTSAGVGRAGKVPASRCSPAGWWHRSAVRTTSCSRAVTSLPPRGGNHGNFGGHIAASAGPQTSAVTLPPQRNHKLRRAYRRLPGASRHRSAQAVSTTRSALDQHLGLREAGAPPPADGPR